MAIYHLSVQVGKRSEGRSSVAAAAYRSGSRMTDQRTGKIHDFSRKSVDHAEILLPRHVPIRYKNRDLLWNEAEQAETRKNAQVFRELNIALPRELSESARILAVKNFARENFTDEGMVADLAFHEANGKNPHVHIMLTMREMMSEGFHEKKSTARARSWNDKELVPRWRKSWAHHANQALALAGSAERIDHRTLADQGIEREPQIHLGHVAMAMAANGEASERFDEYLEIEARNAELIETQRQLEELRLQELELYQTQAEELAREAVPEPLSQEDRENNDRWVEALAVAMEKRSKRHERAFEKEVDRIDCRLEEIEKRKLYLKTSGGEREFKKHLSDDKIAINHHKNQYEKAMDKAAPKFNLGEFFKAAISSEYRQERTQEKRVARYQADDHLDKYRHAIDRHNAKIRERHKYQERADSEYEKLEGEHGNLLDEREAAAATFAANMEEDQQQFDHMTAVMAENADSQRIENDQVAAAGQGDNLEGQSSLAIDVQEAKADLDQAATRDANPHRVEKPKFHHPVPRPR